MACLRLLTVQPLPPSPDFRVPRFLRRIALATVLPAEACQNLREVKRWKDRGPGGSRSAKPLKKCWATGFEFTRKRSFNNIERTAAP